MELVTPPTRSFTFLLLVVLMSSVQAQKPCTRSDSIGSNQLSVNVSESDTDPNFNPNLDSYRAQLPLNGNVGQNLLFLTLGQASSDLNPNQYFTIENVEGKGIYVRLINALDRDGGLDGIPAPRNSVVFSLTCTWNGQPTNYDLTIVLRDVNDNSPLFEDLPTTMSLSELEIVGSQVYTVTATDMDSATDGNNVVRYSISSGQIRTKFEIDETTGILTVAERLDYENQIFYPLVIQAKDQGNPSMDSSAFFNITVSD